MQRKYPSSIIRHAISATVLFAVWSCSDIDPVVQGDEAIAFDTSIEEMELTRAGDVGTMTDSQLKTSGFGVFAYSTGSQEWADAKGDVIPNFMYNQRVEWEAFGIKDWVYRPVKYWPNENQPADDAGATGASEHNYLSFFAYAPYVDETLPMGTDGIISFSENMAKGVPTLTYCLSSSPDQQVDLMWGTRGQDRYEEADGTPNTTTAIVNTDLTKQKTAERVNFKFRHALTSIDVYVQRVYDEEKASGKTPTADAAKVFVSELRLTPTSTLFQEGTLDLSTGEWNSGTGSMGEVIIDASRMDANIQGTSRPNTDLTVVQNAELDVFDKKTGVDENMRRLTELPYATLLIPTNSGITVTPTISYSFVTQDPSLVLNMPNSTGTAYYSRITHEVTGSAVTIGTEVSSGVYKLEAGKRYVLVCYIGVESVQFQVLSIEDWDFPLRFIPSIDPFKTVDYNKGTQTPSEWQGKTVNE